MRRQCRSPHRARGRRKPGSRALQASRGRRARRPHLLAGAPIRRHGGGTRGPLGRFRWRRACRRGLRTGSTGPRGRAPAPPGPSSPGWRSRLKRTWGAHGQRPLSSRRPGHGGRGAPSRPGPPDKRPKQRAHCGRSALRMGMRRRRSPVEEEEQGIDQARGVPFEGDVGQGPEVEPLPSSLSKKPGNRRRERKRPCLGKRPASSSPWRDGAGEAAPCRCRNRTARAPRSERGRRSEKPVFLGSRSPAWNAARMSPETG